MVKTYLRELDVALSDAKAPSLKIQKPVHLLSSPNNFMEKIIDVGLPLKKSHRFVVNAIYKCKENVIS